MRQKHQDLLYSVKINTSTSAAQALHQRRDEWGLDDEKIKETLTGLREDGVEEENISAMHLFLYAKGFFAEKSKVIRKEEFHLLFTDPKNQRALDRLKTIVEIGEISPSSSKGPAAKMESWFAAFVGMHPEWSDEKSFVVFRDHNDLKGKAHAHVERFKKTGLCYMHAPVVLQHYLVAMTNQQRIPMLDMVSYLRKKMPAKTLYNHIWENEGGSSLSFLKIILHDKPMATEMEFFKGKNLLTANLASNLEDYGPALISNFQVSSQFKDMNQWQHLGKDDGKILGSHAMVLVGYRIVNGQVRYLVQNWWKQKAYIEVDASYLANCDATITFFLKKQTQMGDFDSNHEALVECDADACEQQELEGSEIN